MTAYELWVVLGMTAVTFGVRYPVLALVSRVRLPATALHTLRYIPPSVLAAIILPALLAPSGTELELSLANPFLIAGLVAAILAWRTRSLMPTITIGMALFLAWSWIVRTYLGA